MNRPVRRRPRLVLIGWGAIGQHVVEHLTRRDSAVDLVGIAVRDAGRQRAFLDSGPAILTAPDELAVLSPDIVVEAAGRDAVATWVPAALAVAPAVAIASTSAFADDALLGRLVDLADRHDSRILVPPGALGGIDALSGAATAGLDAVRHTVTKPPAAWRGTRAETILELDRLSEPCSFFVGSARDAARDYPQNANATVVTALAGVGLDRTEIELVADPGATRNRHRIEATGAFGRLVVELENAPLPTNPKSSALTALSLVRLIENQSTALVI